MPESIPTWFEESHLKSDKNEIKIEITAIVGKNLTNDDAAKMITREFQFIPVSVLGRNRWSNSVESNKKVVIRI